MKSTIFLNLFSESSKSNIKLLSNEQLIVIKKFILDSFDSFKVMVDEHYNYNEISPNIGTVYSMLMVKYIYLYLVKKIDSNDLSNFFVCEFNKFFPNNIPDRKNYYAILFKKYNFKKDRNFLIFSFLLTTIHNFTAYNFNKYSLNYEVLIKYSNYIQLTLDNFSKEENLDVITMYNYHCDLIQT